MIIDPKERLLFSLAHCPFLTLSEKWQLAAERITELKELGRMGNKPCMVSEKKRASFLRYDENMPIMQLNDRYKASSVYLLSILSPDYPHLLKESFDPPLILFCKGERTLLSGRLLGIVGARDCTAYASNVLDILIPDLTRAGITIVSGLAKGVDSTAHHLTMTAGGETVGVVGTGLDQAYPAQNRTMQKRMGEEQLVVSEYPFGTSPRREHFPARNRIIAGLTRGTLVVEAKKRSGSLITARLALEEGRDVFAVPGSVLSELSVGSNELIRSGAISCLRSSDILEEWNVY
ncbi:DNA-processing protein DprA [Alkalibacterium pelagium]|uniref:DNA processing protein n=1 Tax=Alkalibacterium pelagium TaxID=426702 RepID=A0A1H7JR17_9LACT|nr:DNA-processing protein DprA [Alkalibacterium pelagium]GEN50591.1 DNA processing protein DprA [Alkalibacterium pelagium]SEK76287.1 DNA processing protein [Alkalibacterium pelagium]